jgi:hypothetical protein
MIEREILGKLGEAAGNKVIQGSTSYIYRFITRLAVKRGVLVQFSNSAISKNYFNQNSPKK